jgi:hypothetical protein
MKIKKFGYIVSAILYIISAIISRILKLGTMNTYWALFNVFIIVIPAFIQTIFNIKSNKNSDGVIVLYILFGMFTILFLAGILISFLLLFKIIEAPLY